MAKVNADFKSMVKTSGSVPSADTINRALLNSAQPVLEERARSFVQKMVTRADRGAKPELSSALKQLRVERTMDGVQVKAPPTALDTIRRYEYGNEEQRAFAVLRRAQDEEQSALTELRSKLRPLAQRTLRQTVRG